MAHEVYTNESCLTIDNTFVSVNLVLRGLIKRKVKILKKKKKKKQIFYSFLLRGL